MATEGFILDPTGSSPLDLVSGTQFGMAALTIPPAKRRPEWASSGDADGSELVREPFYDDRDCSMQVRVVAATMDLAVAAIGKLQGKLQEAIKLAAGGGDGLRFLWTPANATVGLTGYIKLAEITDLPVEFSSGWFQARPLLTVAFTAKPFLYGSEVTGPTATGTTPVLTVAVPTVPGDVPAEARLVVSDGSSQARRWVEWGLEQRYYNAGSPSSLLIDSEDLVTSGFAGALATRTGGYRRAAATHDTVSATLLSQPIALCGTGDQPHIGTFRLKARIWATSTAEFWRLTWKSGDGPYISNDWVQPIAAADFTEIDLGLIDVDQAVTGSQKWSGRIEAYTTTAAGEVGEVDYLAILPQERSGRLEASYAYTSSTLISGRDGFTGTTAGSALNARTAPAGGSWATSGVATDFVFHDNASGAGSEELTRTTTADTDYRYGILGTSTFTDVEVGCDIFLPDLGGGTVPLMGLVARWTDANNLLRFRTGGVGIFAGITLESFSAGIQNFGVATTYDGPLNIWAKLRLIAYSTGRAVGLLLDGNGNELARVDVLGADLASPSGGNKSGKVGLADKNNAGVSNARYYDNFYVATPAAEPLIINSGRSLQVRSDSNLRLSSDGTTYGDIPSRGSRLFIPQAGDAARTARIAVRAAREDPVTQASRNDGDSITISTFYTPRYLAVPR